MNKPELKRQNSCLFSMLAKTLRGAEDVVADELRTLGAATVQPTNCAVKFTGDKRLLYKANLCSRTAMRILVPLRIFKAKDKDELYQRVSTVNWSRYMDTDGTLAVDAFISDSAFDNSIFVAQRVKDAIVDQFRRHTGKRPSVDLNDPDLRLNIYIQGSLAVLSLDSSGEPLYRRGYRTEAGEAPINEVLAATLITLTGWDGKITFLDPMCGSGTFLIEAAMMARRIAPGRARRFGFMRWKDYDTALFESVLAEAEGVILPEAPGVIIGSDIDPERIREVRANARRANVLNDIRLECKSFEEKLPPPPPGILIMNPPYDKRLGLEDVGSFYRMIGDTLKSKYEGYNAFIFTSNAQAAKSVGLQTSRRITLFNGPLECRLLKYEIYRGSHKAKYQNPL